MMKMSYWTYVLQKPEGRFYMGHTEDLERRVSEHNSPEPVFGSCE